LAKKYIKAATIFCALTSLNFMISSTELTWLVNKRIEDLDGEFTNTAVLASIAMLSYD